MSQRVYFNFEDGPVDGSVNMGVVYEGGFNKDRPLHRFCVNVQKLIEKEALSKDFEVLNGEERVPSTAPEATL